MKIRITKAEDCTWYADKIGKVFEVFEDDLIGQDDKVYTLKRDRGKSITKHILPQDCEIVSDEWWEGLDGEQIHFLKINELPLCRIEKNNPELARAFREMPSEDRVFMDNNGYWTKASMFIKPTDGTIYRLRKDWERPDPLRELVEKIEVNEYTLRANLSPFDLMDDPLVQSVMEEACKVELCEYYYDHKWEKAADIPPVNLSIRLAPDWREKLKQKEGIFANTKA